MKKILRTLLQIAFFILLTATTQIGGVVFLLSLWVSNSWKAKFSLKTPAVFLALYMVATFAVTPLLAPAFGREKINTTQSLRPATWMTILLNRNYVTPALQVVLQDLSKNHPLRFLDANFPFIGGFPLLPHLSHNDGCKIDLAFIYKNQEGKITGKIKSNSGYGVFEAPKPQEYDQISKCKSMGYFQYDYPKYLTFGTKNSGLKFSVPANKKLISYLVKNPLVEKVFIEPHLVTRLQLNSSKIRYHGCRAVRHDDHIHLQIKPE